MSDVINPNNSNMQSNAADEVEISLHDIVSLIKYNYKFVLIITVICFFIGVEYATSLPPSYQSTALLQVQQDASPASKLMGALERNSSSGIKTVNTNVEKELLQSRYILGMVADKMKMNISASPKYSSLFDRFFSGFSSSTNTIKVTELSLPNDLIGSPLTLTVLEKNKYKVTTANGKLIFNGVVGQPISQQGNKSTNITVTTLDAKPGEQFIVTQRPLNDAASGLLGGLTILPSGTNTGILQLNFVASNPGKAQTILNNILQVAVDENVTNKSSQAEKSLNYLTAILPEIEKKLDAAEDSLNNYREQSGNADATDQIQLLWQKLATAQGALDALELKKIELSKDFTPQHPAMIAINEKEAEMQKRIDVMEGKLKALPGAAQQEAQLKRNVTLRNEMYSLVAKNMLQLQLLKGGMVSDVRILSTATYPYSPLKTRKVLIIIASAVLGFVLSIFGLLLRKMLSRTIDNPDTVEKALSTPVMVILPFSAVQQTLSSKMKEKERHAALLLAQEKPKDLAIEGMRSLRTSLKLSLLGAENNILSISGCSPNVGKSFISVNLAFLFSDLDSKVLLIDSDVRGGHTFKYFGKEKTPGLSEYLKGEVSAESIIQNITPGKLDFISTGTFPDRPAELLMNEKYGQLLDNLKTQYDLVIIDTPPVLAVTDAAIVMKHSATNLLVVGAGRDQLKELVYGKKLLEKAGIDLTGLVYNSLSKHSAKLGYGYGYGYYNYYYSYESKNEK